MHDSRICQRMSEEKDEMQEKEAKANTEEGKTKCGTRKEEEGQGEEGWWRVAVEEG